MSGQFLLLLAFAAPAVTTNLVRQEREDTIYVLRAQPDALRSFHKDHGEDWTGGAVVDPDASDGKLTYWAYPDRTAAESRAIIMPAIFSGIDVGIEDYDEAQRFPAERESLDGLARRCGVTEDPFFLTPNRTVQITFLKSRGIL